jgi:hypothetical protein
MNDAGKGIANMFTVYLTGRYIRQYHDDKLEARKMFAIGSVIIGCSFVANYLLSLLVRGGLAHFLLLHVTIRLLFTLAVFSFS